MFFYRLEWETSVVKGAGMLESLEEERLAQLKTTADCYLRLTAAVPSQLAEVNYIGRNVQTYSRYKK